METLESITASDVPFCLILTHRTLKMRYSYHSEFLKKQHPEKPWQVKSDVAGKSLAMESIYLVLACHNNRSYPWSIYLSHHRRREGCDQEVT